MDLNRWWLDRENERYWLEVTDRSDAGVNLKAPQRNETGAEFWSYALVREVQSGDVVFHYDRSSQRVIGMSHATGDHWDDWIVWGARGTYAREAGIVPHERPGWYAGLSGFGPLTEALDLNEIRDKSEQIRGRLESLGQEVDGPLYFPFERGENRPIRPLQGYLFKLPSFFVSLFPKLRAEDAPGRRKMSEQDKMAESDERRSIGGSYRRADEELSIGSFDPMEVDPGVVERGTRGHAVTQNALADYLEERDIEPRSPLPTEPDFDLAWEQGGFIWVAEVKSVTNRNEERQLRMGLGQVLKYSYQLRRAGSTRVIAVLVSERKPPKEWIGFCESLDVRLAWPGAFERLGS